LAESGSLRRSVLFGAFFLDSGDMQAGHRHAAIVVKPNDYTTSVRIDTCVIRTGYAIPVTAAGDDKERLEWASL